MELGLKRANVYATGVGSIPTRGNRIFNFVVLVSRQSVGLSSSIQHAMLPDFGGSGVS